MEISSRTYGILRITAIITLIIFLAIFIAFIPQLSNNIMPKSNTVYIFYGAECSHCHDVMPFINDTMKKYPNVTFEVLEIWYNETNKDIAMSMNKQLNVTNWGVPEVIINGKSIIGSKDIKDNIEAELNNISSDVK